VSNVQKNRKKHAHLESCNARHTSNTSILRPPSPNLAATNAQVVFHPSSSVPLPTCVGGEGKRTRSRLECVGGGDPSKGRDRRRD
jgi:hypothetical protein